MDMKFKTKESIALTKKSFEDSFTQGDFYNRQTQDHEHLTLILNRLHIQAGMKILDLGTGIGFMAFPIAEKYPEAEITGLDIVEHALHRNQELANQKKLHNLEFVSYDGMKFPFADQSFNLVITRYALHHFPSIHETFQEIKRVLKSDGILFISDPTPNENDTERFVDAYMQMKRDGHIRFYSLAEWQIFAHNANFNLIDNVDTWIRFPRKKQAAFGFADIIKAYDDKVIQGYEVEEIDDEIWITEKVNNLLFRKL